MLGSQSEERKQKKGEQQEKRPLGAHKTAL
jgi:hypothetical protein